MLLGTHASATALMLWGLVAHLIADWLFQNDWMAANKASPKHPAAWVHSGIHLIALLLIFPWFAAIALAITHLLIDTRVPLIWWRRVYRQTTEGPVAMHVAIWGDQVAHVACIAIAAVIVAAIA